MEAIPGYPVYYAPRADANFFFYDGMYWVYAEDNWYVSSWYGGPWDMVRPGAVPLFMLRVPVRYYRRPPAYFSGWLRDAPPRWGDHWGRTWEQSRSGWDRWDRNAAPTRAPLPNYQRQYSGNRYPRAEHQPGIQRENYQYQPREATVRERWQPSTRTVAPVPAQRDSRPAPARAPQGNARPVTERAPQAESHPQQGARQGNQAREPQAERGNSKKQEHQAQGERKGQDDKDKSHR
jgi:hypothetical protein